MKNSQTDKKHIFLFRINEKTHEVIKGNPPGKELWKKDWNTEFKTTKAIFRAPNKKVGDEERGLNKA